MNLKLNLKKKKDTMKRNIKEGTNGYYILEIVIASILMIGIIWLGFTLKERHRRIKSEPTVTDLIQQQDMIDYARSEGRTINTY